MKSGRATAPSPVTSPRSWRSIAVMGVLFGQGLRVCGDLRFRENCTRSMLDAAADNSVPNSILQNDFYIEERFIVDCGSVVQISLCTIVHVSLSSLVVGLLYCRMVLSLQPTHRSTSLLT